jgi:hypothetical protein
VGAAGRRAGHGDPGSAALVALCQVAFGVVTARDVFPGAGARGLRLTAGGLLMLGGLALRRRSRVASDLTIAAAALPGVPWIWMGSIWFDALAFSAITVVVAAAVDAAESHHLGRKGRHLGGDERMLLGNGIAFADLDGARFVLDRPEQGTLQALHARRRAAGRCRLARRSWSMASRKAVVRTHASGWS